MNQGIELGVFLLALGGLFYLKFKKPKNKNKQCNKCS